MSGEIFLVIIGIFGVLSAIGGIIEGEISPTLGAAKRYWIRRKEKPVYFWIFSIGVLLIGLSMILYAISIRLTKRM
jgi:hypothetical protein